MKLPLPAILALVLVFAPGSSVHAATFVVDAVGDAGDNNPGDGICDSVLAGLDCTLRAAVQEANVLVGADMVTIPTLIITLDLVGVDDAAVVGDLDILDDLVITGSPFTVLRATHGSPIFEVRGGSLDLSNLTLEDGGVESLVGTTLEITDVDMNRSVVHRGHGALRRVTITGANAVPVTNEGTLTISECTITSSLFASSADYGAGAIDNSGVLLIERSRFENNDITNLSAVLTAGALLNRSSGRVRAANTRFAGNRAFGGFGLNDAQEVVNAGWMSWSHVTVAGFFNNGAPLILDLGTFEVSRSFIADSDSATLCWDFSGGPTSFTSLGYNVFGDGSCLTTLGPGDVENSTAIADHVPAGQCANQDRLGSARPVGDACNAGSVESPFSGACQNGVDDDGDGFVDLQDPGCRDADDPLEAHLRPGDVLVGDFDDAGLLVLDPSSTIIAPISRAMGLVNPYDIAVDTTGNLLIGDYGLSTLSEIDPETGLATLISGGGILGTPTGIELLATGEILLADSTSDVIQLVDRTTGAQTLLSLLDDPDFPAIDDFLLDPTDGSLLVSDILNGIFRVSDPLGSFTVSPFAATTEVTRPRQMAFDAAGDLLIADETVDAPIRLDLGTGLDSLVLPGTPFSFMWGAAVEPGGHSLFSDRTTGLITRVNDAADTATPLNFGRVDAGLAHLAMVSSDHNLSLTLDHALVIDGGTAGVVDPGDTVELTATVENIGSTTADLLSLESGLDPNLTLVASQLTTTQGTIVEGSLVADPRIEVDLGSLAPAATATVTWRVDVSDPAPARFVTANAWMRREKLILVESDDPGTAQVGDRTVMGVGDYGVVVEATQKIADIRGDLSGPGNPGSLLNDGAFFGAATSLGLFDGDSIPDLAVGARGQHGGGTNRGSVFVLTMNADGTVKTSVEIGDGSAGLTLPDETRFASSVANLGDVDGDGTDDLAVGAPYDDTGGDTDPGAAYVLFLNPDGTLKTHQKIADLYGGGPALDDSDNFGEAVTRLGDLNGDSIPDLGVGARWDDDAGTDYGAFYVLFLDTDGTVKTNPAPVKISTGQGGFVGPITGRWFGTSAALLGDLDGDSRPEVAIGNDGTDDGDTDTGSVWIVSLRSAAAGDSPVDQGKVFDEHSLNAASVSGLGTELGFADRFGSSVAALGDIDADGVEDLGVAAAFDDDGGLDRGAVYLMSLNTDKTVKRVDKISETRGGFTGALDDSDRFGWDLALLGDLSNDGSVELAVGARNDDDGGSGRGSVYVVSLATPVPEPGQVLMLAAGAALLAAMNRRRKKGEEQR